LLSSPWNASLSRVESHISPDLMRQILASKAFLEGEHKDVTVFFADVKGSTELIANLATDDARQLLDPVLELMIAAVHAFQGTVNQIMGDGIMALFGAPLAQEDHAIRACHAALKCQESVRKYAEKLRVTSRTDLQVRIGLHSGEVLVRAIKNDLRLDYSAVGQTAHLASRMEQMASPGTTYMTSSTLERVAGLFDVREVGAVPVRGFAAPVSTYELVAGREDHIGHRRLRAVGELARFTGRAVEMAALERAVTAAEASSGQMIALVGDPGVGKSRLAHELIASERLGAWRLLEARSVSYGARTPYFPVVHLLRSYFGVAGEVISEDARTRISERLLATAAGTEVLEPILWLLGASTGTTVWNNLDASEQRRRALEAIKRVVLHESRRQPVCILFEDIHWIDPESEQVIDSIAEVVPNARILLIITYRPDYHHSWGAKTFYTQLRIDPFPPTTAVAFLDSILGGDPSLGDLKEMLVSRTQGNPFFLEESCRALIESGTLAGEQERFRLNTSIARHELPSSINGVIAARIDRLPPPAKELLQAAAVLGKNVSGSILARLANVGVGKLAARTRSLQQAEFLSETEVSPPAYTFRHALTHEVAYGTLPVARRKALHAKALEAIETLQTDELEEHTEELAHHAASGEIWHKAAHYYRQGGNQAAMRSAFSAAAARYRSAIAALTHLPPDDRNNALHVDLRFALYTALLAQGDHQPIFTVLDEAEKLATLVDDKKRLARVYGYQSMAYWWVADYERALIAGTRALGLARELKHHGLQGIALVALGWIYHSRGQFKLSIDSLSQMLEIYRKDPTSFRVLRGAPLLQVMALSWMSYCEGELGRSEQALQCAREAVQIAEEADHSWSRATAYRSLGLALLHAGQVGDAISVLERGLQLCESCGISSWANTTRWSLGYAKTVGGRAGEGLPLLQGAVKQAEAVGNLAQQSIRLAHLAEATCLAGEAEDAVSRGQSALQLARQHGERASEAHILRILGDIASVVRPGDMNGATRNYEEAARIAEELEMMPLARRCREALHKAAASLNTIC
jgi:class 3 adenylate cyclase/tetratricopeptide (TPR) repeat protein